MIVTTDIANIIYKRCKEAGFPGVMQKGAMPSGRVDAERTAIAVKRATASKFWSKCPVTVNFCVPNIAPGVADLKRLQELERQADAAFRHTTCGKHDGTMYKYRRESIGLTHNTADGYSAVSVELTFETINVKP